MTLSGFLKGVIYTSLAIVPALAWYVSESTFFPFITGKNFSFRFLIEIALVAYAWLAMIEPAYRPKKSILFYSYLFFLGVLFVANILGASPYLSFFGNYERMEGWFTHLHLFLYFTVLYSVYKTEGDWLKIFGWLTVSALAVSTEAVFQLFGQKDFFLTKFLGENLTVAINTVYPTHMGNGLRLDSTLGNAAYYGVYALFFVFISMLLAFRMNKWSGKQNYSSFVYIILATVAVLSQNFFNMIATKVAVGDASTANLIAGLGSVFWFAGVIALIFLARSFVTTLVKGNIGSWPFTIFAFVNAILLYYTQTRGSYFGLIIGLFVTMLCIVFFGRKKYKKLAKYSTYGIAIVAALIIAFVSIKDTAFVKNSVGLNRLATIKMPSLSKAIDSTKTGTYEDMLHTFGEGTIVSRVLNLKMGIEGVSKSPRTMLLGYGEENYSKVFAENYDARMYAQEAWFDRAHNVFIDWLVAGGIIGLIAYLALYLTPIYMMWRGKGKDNMSIVERSIITGALVAYFVHNIFVFDNLISYIIFVTILAYVGTRSHDLTEAKNELKNAKIYSQKVVTATVSFVAAIALGLLTFTVVRPLMTNLDIISGFRKFPVSYDSLTASTTEAFGYFKTAYERNTFGSVETSEQMLQKSLILSQVDLSKMQKTDADKAALAITDFVNYTEDIFKKSVESNPTARNTSVLGSYFRQKNDNVNSLKYLEQAYNIAPTKQAIAFEYAASLIANNRTAEALVVAEKAYRSDPTYKEAKDFYQTILDSIKVSVKKIIDIKK